MIFAQLFEGRRETKAVSVPFLRSYDVIVCGVGTAGGMCALTCAEMGLKTLAIENLANVGGMHTVGEIWPYYFGVPGGRYVDIDAQARRAEDPHDFLENCWQSGIRRAELDARLAATGVQLALEATAVGIYMRDNAMAGVCYVDRDGAHDVAASVIVDCTSDASISRMAGVPLHEARAVDGTRQFFSNIMVHYRYGMLSAVFRDDGCVCPDGWEALSSAIIDSSLNSMHRAEVPDPADRLIRPAALLGQRETFQVKCEKTLELEALLNGRLPDEPIFYARANLDNHATDIALESRLLRDFILVAGLWGVYFTVPICADMMLPAEIDGLIVAGKHISATHDTSSMVRMKADVLKCGEAAGAIAAVAHRHGVAPRHAPLKEVKEILSVSGCLCHEPTPSMALGRISRTEPFSFAWLTNPEAIYQGLCSDAPGIAIWSCRRLGESIREKLVAWMGEIRGTGKTNCALALALIGAQEAAPVLIEQVAARENNTPLTSWHRNYSHCVSAASALEHIAPLSAAAELMAVVEDSGSVDFNLFTSAVRSLLAIAQAYPQKGKEIVKRLNARIEDMNSPIQLSMGNSAPIDRRDALRALLMQYEI